MLQTNNKYEDEVRGVLAKIIEVNPSKINLETNLIEELGADSMMALEIMAALEKKYTVTIPEEDLPKMTSLQEILNLLDKLRQNV